MEIRKSVEADLDRIMEIYARARRFMAEHGNPNQWGPTNWPPEALIRQDIDQGNGYVCIDEGRIVGTFFFLWGKDVEPTYGVITDGKWLDDSPYGVIHRIASDGTRKGVGEFCLNWAFEQCPHLRIDTHEDNIVMQNLLGKLGFIHCGTIYVHEDRSPRLAYEKVKTDVYIGVDGCKGGWIAAILDRGSLRIERFTTIREIIRNHPVFDFFLIDMAVGLRNSPEQLRPDDLARKELGRRSSTVFPIPSREAVYAEGEDAQKEANLRVLGKSLSRQTINILPKLRELDEFLDVNPRFKNRILESHPELDFARLSGAVLMSRKKERNGLEERIAVLKRFLPACSFVAIAEKAKELKCSTDDIADALCLAVTASLAAREQCETIPPLPEQDEKGLYMMLTVPKKNPVRT